MLNSKAKLKTENFVRHVEALGQKSSDRLIEGFQGTERELINQFTKDTWDLIKNNELGVGLENLLTNIYEIDFTLDDKAIDLAKEAIDECRMKYDDWTFIEELVK
jgi:hypothetical protein